MSLGRRPAPSTITPVRSGTAPVLPSATGTLIIRPATGRVVGHTHMDENDEVQLPAGAESILPTHGGHILVIATSDGDVILRPDDRGQ